MEDPQWTDVDTYAEFELRKGDDRTYDAALAEARRLSEISVMPGAEVSPLQGRFLASQCRLINARNVLEIGTLTACSTIWLASSSPDIKVTSIEKDPGTAELAAQVVQHANVSNRVEILVGDAVDILPTLRAQVESGSRPRFDFVFVDADKQNNLKYFEHAIAMCRSLACIVVDNVVRKGGIVDDAAAAEDGRIRGARQVIEAAGNREDILGATVLQTVGEKGWDGFLMCVVA